MSAEKVVRHGTHEGYVSDGCRCPDCREAKRVYMQEYRIRKRSGTYVFRNRIGADDWSAIDALTERVGDDFPALSVTVRAMAVMSA